MGKTVTTDSLAAEDVHQTGDAPQPQEPESITTESLINDTLVTGSLNDEPEAPRADDLDNGLTYTVMPRTGRHVQVNGKVIPIVVGEPIQVGEQVYRFLLGLGEVDAVEADKVDTDKPKKAKK